MILRTTEHQDQWSPLISSLVCLCIWSQGDVTCLCIRIVSPPPVYPPCCVGFGSCSHASCISIALIPSFPTGFIDVFECFYCLVKVKVCGCNHCLILSFAFVGFPTSWIGALPMQSNARIISFFFLSSDAEEQTLCATKSIWGWWHFLASVQF